MGAGANALEELEAVVDDLAEGREALGVEEVVVGEVHEDLGRARVLPRGREGHGALAVADVARVVHNVGAVLVHLVDLRVAAEAPLHHEVVRVAEEASLRSAGRR